jgi:ubiquinone/menaquinone biosynthesis C-methylase UbiE
VLNNGNKMANWNSIFKNKGKVFNTPHEDMNALVQILKKNKAKRVLDLGCGSGRHTVFLAKAGFEVYALDNAPEGLKQTRAWLKEKGLKANLKNSSCYKKFPYKDDFFDAVISIQVIHHAKANQIRRCIKEIERVLKQGGTTFITVTKNKTGERGTKIKQIEPRTYVMLDGFEKGVPHYIYNKSLLRQFFKNFKIYDIYIDSGDHYCLLGELK